TATEATCTPTTGTLSASVVRVDGSDGFDGDFRGRGFGGLLRGPVARTPAVLTQKRGGREDHRVVGTRGGDLVADGTDFEVGCGLLQSGFEVHPRAEVDRVVEHAVDETVDEGEGRFPSEGDEGRADEGFDGVGEDRVLVPAAGQLFALAQQNVL